MEYLLLSWSRSGVRVGVRVEIFRPESESKSLKIRRLRSPGYTIYNCMSIVLQVPCINLLPANFNGSRKL